MSKYLINLSSNIVTMGNVFSTEKSYLYKTNLDLSTDTTKAFTKTLYIPGQVVYQETLEGSAITSFTQIPIRESLPPDVPFAGAFFSNYSVNGTLNTSSFINLLLIDKPPIRTGFFDFYVKDVFFTGFITKLTQYKHYNWQQVGGKYRYVEQPVDLGYGIEISNNQLYYAVLQPDGSYKVTPNDLFYFLRNLKGNEEIISTPSSLNPSTYINNIPGLPEDTVGSLPISLFYISAADALRYVASYPELIQSVGADPAAAQQLYASTTGSKIITFNPIAYLNKYSDIRSLYGYDTYSATIHYITTGYAQGRTLENSSGEDPLVGGLYDERNTAIFSSTSDALLWPEGETLAGYADTLSYVYGNKSYYLNGAVPVTGNLKYLGVH
jgi:hypothetical protein